jgi:hypothetical protein
MTTRRNLLQTLSIPLAFAATASVAGAKEERPIDQLADALAASCAEREGGNWKADLALDVGLIMIRRTD